MRASAKVNKLSYVLMGGHICVDTVQGGLAALLPFLVLQGGYSYAQVTMLILASNIASAIIQPLFGWLGDRKPRPWIMALGVFLAGVGIAVIGVSDAYAAVVFAAMISGIGNAMLHPEGGRLANVVGGTDKAASMSVFSVGGQIGFCVGPVVTVAVVSAFGLAGTMVYLALCVPYAAVLLMLNARFASYGLRGPVDELSDERPDRWGVFSLVLGALSVRSIVFYGMTSFVPLFMVAVFGQSEQVGSSMITVFSAVGAVATLLSGKVARTVKTTHLMVGCFAAMACAVVGFAISGSVYASMACVLVVSVCLNLFNPPAIALGQSFVPHHLGMASGLSFGVAVCIGGVVSPALGSLGDALGLVPVMYALAALAVIGLLFSLGVMVLSRRR